MGRSTEVKHNIIFVDIRIFFYLFYFIIFVSYLNLYCPKLNNTSIAGPSYISKPNRFDCSKNKTQFIIFKRQTVHWESKLFIMNFKLFKIPIHVRVITLIS